MQMFGYSYLEASRFLAIMKGITLVFTPIVSYFIMKYGCKLKVMFFSVLLGLSMFIIMLFLPAQPSTYVYLVNIGIACFYTLYNTCLWPCLSLSMPRQAVTYGYCVATICQMVTMTIFPDLIGRISNARTYEAYRRVV